MPFSETTPANVTASLSDLLTFFNGLMGWTASLSGATLEVRIPGKDEWFDITAIENVQEFSTTAAGKIVADNLRVELKGTPSGVKAQANFLTPISRLVVHGGADPEPWALISYETAPGYFSHTYFGFLDKLGQYDGGAVVSTTRLSPQLVNSTNFNSWSAYLNTTPNMWYNALLFRGNTNWAADEVGGVEVIHPDAPAPGGLYPFAGRSGSTAYGVGGGLGDAHNGLLSIVEYSGIDGSVNGHPVVLSATLSGDGWQTPVGCVPGIMMINVDALSAGEVVTIGGDNWQIFPACNRSLVNGRDPSIEPGTGPGDFTPGTNTSNFVNAGGSTERWGIAVRRE